MDGKKGDLLWKYDAGAPVLSSPAVAKEMVYLASERGMIFALDRAEGKLKWAFDITAVAPSNAKILSSPAIADGHIYVGCSRGIFFSIGGR